MNATIRAELKIKYEALRAKAVNESVVAALDLQNAEHERLMAQQKEANELAAIAEKEAHDELMAT